MTIHDTAVDGTTPFDANALGQGGRRHAVQATRERRCSSPGSKFREFFFDETGDTNADTEAGADLRRLRLRSFELTQRTPARTPGTLHHLSTSGDKAHAGFDNCAFLSTRTTSSFVEDAGDGLHTQRNALDSAFDFDVTADYADGAPADPVPRARVATPSATIDSALSPARAPASRTKATTRSPGIHVSNGDPTAFGILGAPRFPSASRARLAALLHAASTATTSPYQIVRRPFTFRPEDEERAG